MGPSIPETLKQCLAKRRRRVVLTHLLDSLDQSATVEELVGAVIEAESHAPSPSSLDPESVAITLDHVHLPMLVDAGFIEYERDQGIVTTTSRITAVEPYLNGIQSANQADQFIEKRKRTKEWLIKQVILTESEEIVWWDVKRVDDSSQDG